MKKHVKQGIDFLMSILFILCMGYQITGNTRHEILGVVLFLGFIIHCILNGYWFVNYKKILKNSFTRKGQLISFIIDNLVILNMIILMITSIIISRDVFAFLGLRGNHFIKWLHIASANIGFVLLSIHLGCHWNLIWNQIAKACRINRENVIVKIVVKAIALILFVLGSFTIIKNEMWTKIIYRVPQKHNFEDFTPGNAEKPEGNSNDGTDSEIKENHSPENEFGNYAENGQGKGLGKGQGKGLGRGKHKNQNISANMEINENTSVTEGETLEEYLGKLVCTGCGRQCLLTMPKCATGVEQAEQAKEYYMSQNQGMQSDELAEENDTGAKIDENENETSLKEEESKNKVVISGDENLISLFADYLPMAGMYIAGTYYVLELIKKKKEDKK